jgi:hypothetical protein
VGLDLRLAGLWLLVSLRLLVDLWLLVGLWLVGLLLLGLSLHLLHAPLPRLLISIALGECKSCHKQGHCRQGGDDCLMFHEALLCSAGVRSSRTLSFASRQAGPCQQIV